MEVILWIANELNDIPNPPGSYYNAGWLKDDAAFLIYDRFDIWKVNPENRNEPINLTQNGRQNNTVYRLIKFKTKDSDKGIDPTKTAYLKGHNETTRADSYYEFDLNKQNVPKELFAENYKLSTPKIAKYNDVIVLTKEDFVT